MTKKKAATKAKLPAKKLKQAVAVKKKPSPKARIDKRRAQPPTDMAPPHYPDSRPVHVPPAGRAAKTSTRIPRITEDDPGTRGAHTPAEYPEDGVAVKETPAMGLPRTMVDRIPHGQVLYGSQCTWWDFRRNLPEDQRDVDVADLHCPACKGMLLDLSTEEVFWQGATSFENGSYLSISPAPRKHPGYVAFMHWLQGKCFPKVEDAAVGYYNETGKRVDPRR